MRLVTKRVESPLRRLSRGSKGVRWLDAGQTWPGSEAHYAEIDAEAEQRFRDVARRNGGRAEWRSSRSDPGADVGLFLARHGVKVTVARQSGADYEVGAQILSRASDISADLIVMGAYGHARVREIVLGGVTRTLLESMTVPVLMSH